MSCGLSRLFVLLKHNIVIDAQTGESFCTCHGMTEQELTERKDGMARREK